MDVIDSGADTAQLFLDMELRRQQIRGATKQPTGFCYNCGEPITEGLYCDAECAADDEKRETVTHKQHARDSVLL